MALCRNGYSGAVVKKAVASVAIRRTGAGSDELIYVSKLDRQSPANRKWLADNQKITIEDGHIGRPDLHVIADSKTWICILMKERNVVWALVRRKIRLKGPLKLLVAFGKCFPG